MEIHILLTRSTLLMVHELCLQIFIIGHEPQMGSQPLNIDQRTRASHGHQQYWNNSTPEPSSHLPQLLHWTKRAGAKALTVQAPFSHCINRICSTIVILRPSMVLATPQPFLLKLPRMDARFLTNTVVVASARALIHLWNDYIIRDTVITDCNRFEDEIIIFLYTFSLFSHKTPWYEQLFESGQLRDWMIPGYLYQPPAVLYTCLM